MAYLMVGKGQPIKPVSGWLMASFVGGRSGLIDVSLVSSEENRRPGADRPIV